MRKSSSKKFPETIQSIVNSAIQPVRVMFQDEGRFGRISQLLGCWVPAGIRPIVPAQHVREYTYVFSAISPHDGLMDSLILPEVNSLTMSLFLAEVARRHLDEHIVMVMDGASWHKSKELEVPDNMQLIFLPPYSPELNPVEHLWKEMRQHWFANSVFKSLSALEDLLMEALRTLEYSADWVKSFACFDWIISAVN